METSVELDDRAEYAAAGYIRREHQNLFSSNDQQLFQNIPDGVCILCALYFGSRDYFAIASDSQVSVSDDKMTVTKNTKFMQSNPDTSFGSMLKPSTSQSVCKWDLKVLCRVTQFLTHGKRLVPFCIT